MTFLRFLGILIIMCPCVRNRQMTRETCSQMTPFRQAGVRGYSGEEDGIYNFLIDRDKSINRIEMCEVASKNNKWHRDRAMMYILLDFQLMT